MVTAKAGNVGRGASKGLSLAEHVGDAELRALRELLELCEGSQGESADENHGGLHLEFGEGWSDLFTWGSLKK